MYITSDKYYVTYLVVMFVGDRHATQQTSVLITKKSLVSGILHEELGELIYYL